MATMSVEDRLRDLGLTLPRAASPMGSYVPATQWGVFVFVAGHPPAIDGEIKYRGRVGADLSVEEGYDAARLCALNGLSSAAALLGSLNRVERVLSVRGFVNSGPEFTQHPDVINGASDLLVKIFADAGKHARAAVGAPSLPASISVEVELVLGIAAEDRTESP